MVSSQIPSILLVSRSIHLSKMHRDGEDGAMDLLSAGFTSFLRNCCYSVLIWCLCWDLGQMVFCSVTPASFGIRMRDEGCSVLIQSLGISLVIKRCFIRLVYSFGFMTGFTFHAHHQELQNNLLMF